MVTFTRSVHLYWRDNGDPEVVSWRENGHVTEPGQFNGEIAWSLFAEVYSVL